MLTVSRIMLDLMMAYPVYQLLVAQVSLLNKMVLVVYVPISRELLLINEVVRKQPVILTSKSHNLVNVKHVDLTKDHKELEEAVRLMLVDFHKSSTMMVLALYVCQDKEYLMIKKDVNHVHVLERKF